jgi:outer membrane cobalamin receptor
VVAFRRTITDYIDSYVPLTIGGVVGESFTNSNDEVKVKGYELITSYAFSSSLSMRFSYNDTSSELNNNGTQLRGIPENEIKLGFNYDNQTMPFGAAFNLNNVGKFNARRSVIRGDYTVADLSGYYYFGNEQQHQIVARIENLTDKVYATRVDSGVFDTGGSYIYDNLGVERTLHLSYSYNF